MPECGFSLTRIFPCKDRFCPYSQHKVSMQQKYIFFSKKPFLESTEFGEIRATVRGSRPEVFCKKVVLGNFAKFTGKHLCQSLFFNKVADLRLATLLKKRLWQGCFPVNFAKFRRTPFLREHLRWLLLDCEYSLQNKILT